VPIRLSRRIRGWVQRNRRPAYYLSCVWGGGWRARPTDRRRVDLGRHLLGVSVLRGHHIEHLRCCSVRRFRGGRRAAAILEESGGRSARCFPVCSVARRSSAGISRSSWLILDGDRGLPDVPRRRSPPQGAAVLVMIAVVVAAPRPVAWPTAWRIRDSTSPNDLRSSTLRRRGSSRRIADAAHADADRATVARHRYWIWGENTLYVGYVTLLFSLPRSSCSYPCVQ